MFDSLKARWRAFAAEPAGRRFRRRYRRSRDSNGNRSTVRRAVALASGMILTALGSVMLFLPGPGLLVLVVGLGFFAEESRAFAGVLDGTELRIRRL
jgi:hypothetical protein